MKQKIQSITTLLVVLTTFMFSSVAQAKTEALVNMLTQQLGVTEEQAVGGLGALLSSAQDNMSSSDFEQLGDTIPNMSSLLDAAPKVDTSEEKDSLMSMAGGLMGESGDQLQYLEGAFKSLNMDSEMMAKFSKMLLDYVESEGGQEMMKSLKGALIGG